MNSIAEFSGRYPPLEARANAYRQHLYDAFDNALSGGDQSSGPARALARRRSRMLAATTFGLWLAVRLDSEEAALLCDAVRAEVRSW